LASSQIQIPAPSAQTGKESIIFSMNPIRLSLSGFLSYQESTSLDFTAFDLACIAGANGAGKSSLLDAITWALFGQARKRDESLINSQSNVAEVALVFAYEGNIYRVQRSLPRGKTSQLEFHILQRAAPDDVLSGEDADAGITDTTLRGQWKPLTERTLRETQERIEKTLRMNYETFVNASFFLQGNADQFTQQRSGDRKRILGSILGLEVWELHRQSAAERRKGVEAEIASLDGRLQEINAELVEEGRRIARLKELRTELERLSQLRKTQETALEQIRMALAQLEEQRKLVLMLQKQSEASAHLIAEGETRLIERQQERDAYQEISQQAGEIQAAYQAWLQARQEIETWEGIAARFREQEKLRQEPLNEINGVRARLEQEQQGLRQEEERLASQVKEGESFQAHLEVVRKEIEAAIQKQQRRAVLQLDLDVARQRRADAEAENPRLKADMEDLKSRIDQLEATEGAICPLCGQPLSPQDRSRLIGELQAQGKLLGDRFRANQNLVRDSDLQVRKFEAEIDELGRADQELLIHTETQTRLTERLEQIRLAQNAWEQEAYPRLVEITRVLEAEVYAPQARAKLAEIDAALKAIGYDAAAHDDARRREQEGRSAEERMRSLEKAQAALAPLEREIAELEAQMARLKLDTTQQQEAYEQARQSLDEAVRQAPDFTSAERSLRAIQEQENQLLLEVGAAQQKVNVLEDLKTRRRDWELQREDRACLVGQYKQLERAFGKDGVPALLIEQALPQIEAKANDILDRLSGGSMSVRFITQAAYKDRRREDLRETLDIQISDSSGTRDYEMYSGGEAFRVNFAIRLALSEVLAQRAGARLQTLVIDEGFGSQDAQGRQRLVEAINLVRQDFAKILVITHIDELKDAFPTRIEVEKSTSGSKVSLIQ
jgi:exonuclease SbcC